MPNAFNTLKFQSTHPRGVRLSSNENRAARKSFNPRTREGCDDSMVIAGYHSWGFNPRTREGCDYLALSYHAVYVFQSTHPRGVRPLALTCCDVSVVSIHAPARGATLCNNVTSICWLFQSTHPRGVRLSIKDASLPYIVSIHAPARGATYIWICNAYY